MKAIHKYEKGILFKYPDCPKQWVLGDTVILSDIEEFDGKIFISSDYLLAVGSDSFGVCYFDGTSWKGFAPSKGLVGYQLCAAGKFLYFLSQQGDLYKFDKSGNKTIIDNNKRFAWPQMV